MERGRNAPPDAKAGETATERVGILTEDPVRMAGLSAICADTLRMQVVPLSISSGFRDEHLGLVILDAETTPQVFEVLAVLRRFSPDVRILVLANKTSAEFVERLVEAGARGYLPLDAPEDEVQMAITIVRDGSVWAPRKVLSRVLDRLGSDAAAPATLPQFTARERDVLELLHAGRSNREIANALEIDESTVKAHVGRLMRKVGVTNRIALTMHPLTRLQ
jgi:DNA-binding NarL/FixJ family response regulator